VLKENWKFISRVQRLGDNVFIVFAFIVAYYARIAVPFWQKYLPFQFPREAPELAPLKDYFLILVVAVICFNVTLTVFGAYSSMRLRTAFQLFWIAFLSSIVTLVILAAVLFLFKIEVSRSFIALFAFSVALAISFERFLVLRLLKFWRRKGRNFRNVIICGLSHQAIKLANEISIRPELGVGIRAFADLSTKNELVVDSSKKDRFKSELFSTNPNIPATRIIDGTHAVAQALKEYAIDEVIFTDVVPVMSEVAELITICSEQGVRTTMAADLFSLGVVRSGISYFGGMPLIHFTTPPGDGWDLYAKRVLDVVTSFILLILLSPIFLLVSFLIRVTSSGDVFFKQKRVGLNGRLFTLYKFRSMCVDAEALQKELLQQNEMQGPVFKMKNDPRVTRVGKILRRYSLDELPQLWNVFRGDMSLVGPRPPVPGEVSLYERKDRRRLSMRPGLTCIWQVSGRNKINDFSEWVKLDLEYIDNWSFAFDLWLLFRTIPVVFLGRGN
jgi:exopolysaccharide biosynthesis polyprenyl glycosylphosphotransferase